MANNRIYLVHKPTLAGVFIGKRMGWGWYSQPKGDSMEVFYDYVAENSKTAKEQDDFIIVMEDGINDNFNYDHRLDNGLMIFKGSIPN